MPSLQFCDLLLNFLLAPAVAELSIGHRNAYYACLFECVDLVIVMRNDPTLLHVRHFPIHVFLYCLRKVAHGADTGCIFNGLECRRKPRLPRANRYGQIGALVEHRGETPARAS